MIDTIWVRIGEEIVAECARQDEKWGSQRYLSSLKWLAILIEEVGEVAEETLDNESRARLRAEVVQVAAVCVAWLEALDGTYQPEPYYHRDKSHATRVLEGDPRMTEGPDVI